MQYDRYELEAIFRCRLEEQTAKGEYHVTGKQAVSDLQWVLADLMRKLEKEYAPKA